MWLREGGQRRLGLRREGQRRVGLRERGGGGGGALPQPVPDAASAVAASHPVAAVAVGDVALLAVRSLTEVAEMARSLMAAAEMARRGAAAAAAGDGSVSCLVTPPVAETAAG